MRNYSNRFRETTARTGAPEAPLMLLEINHADLIDPIRVVNDTDDITSNGELFTAVSFRTTLPDDLDQGNPRAGLAVENVGRELTQWLELSGGGQGATVRMMQVLRSDPDVIEWEVTLDLNAVRQTMPEVTGQLGFDDLLNLPGIALTYRPDVAPGLF